MNHIGPLLALAAGLALIGVHVRWRRRTDWGTRRAVWLYLWEMLRQLPGLIVFSAWMLAPRHVLPGQRIPRPRARRMVQALNPQQARNKLH